MSDTTKIPRLLRIREVAKLTGLAPWRIYDLIAQGEFAPHLTIGKTFRIAEDALVKWIAEQSNTYHKDES